MNKYLSHFRRAHDRARDLRVVSPADCGGSGDFALANCPIIGVKSGAVFMPTSAIPATRSRRFAGGQHGTERGVALRLGLRQMMHVGRRAITGDFAQNLRVPTPGMIERFQGQDGRAFPERETVALRVERPALRGRKGLERIETGYGQLTQRMVTAGENA